MISAWTKRFFLGCCLAAPVACVVSVGDDDPIDELPDGAAGGISRAGSGGTAGASGSSGASGNAGNAGTTSVAGSGGEGGSDSIATPICTDEAEDDDCLTCIKQQCCTQWQACNTVTCQEQREILVECVNDMPDADQYNEICIPEAADPEDFLAENTQALMGCVNEILEGDAGIATTRCGVACFGDDIFMD